MNKKGFTLMELLGVIIIITLLTTIAILGVTKIVKSSKEELSETQIESIRLAAEMWGVDNQKYLPNNNECSYITLDDLKKFALIDSNIIDFTTNEKLDDNLMIKITGVHDKFNNLNYKYEVVSTVSNCKKIKINHLAKKNVEVVINPTINGAAVGITPELDTNGNIKPGSTFNIKVNEQDTDGSIFYVLSNEGDYVNLIAQQNITIDGNFTSEPQDNDEWYVSSQDNRYGPQTAYTYLSGATSNWTNIPIIESFSYLDEGNQSNSSYGYQGITTTLDSESGNYITTITPLSASYGDPVTYTNMRARLPYESEITTNTSCKLSLNSSNSGSCPLWMVNYLYSNSTSEKYYTSTMGKVNSTGRNSGYWILFSHSGYSYYASNVYYYGRVGSNGTDSTYYGLRPVITILKSDLLRVM